MSLLNQQFIFSNEARYRIARHVTFWLVSVLFFGLIYHHFIRPNFVISLTEAFIYLPTHLIATYFILYLVIPRYWLKEKYIEGIIGIVFITVVVAFLSYLLTEFAIIPLRKRLGLPLPLNSLMAGFMAGLRGSNTIAGFAAAIKLTKYWYQKNKLNQQLEQEKTKAELQLLKAQLHPHFLFNTLNNLYSFTLLKSDQAPEVVLKLSTLLRYMLYECNVPKVPLEKELKMMQDYMELEKIRYGDRLDLSVHIKGEVTGNLIAPLLLLPFLENSFKHGASEQLDQAWISLDITVKENTFKMKLINGVNSMAKPFDANSTNHGIGMQNVSRRLSLLYPDRYELKTLREAETYLVSLTLQLESVARLPELDKKSTLQYEM